MAALCNIHKGRGEFDGSVKIFTTEGSAGTFVCQSTVSVDAGRGGVKSVSFSPSGDVVAAGCYNGKIYFVDAKAGKIESSVKVDNLVTSLNYAPSGDILAVGEHGGNIHFFNSKGEKASSPVKARSDYVRAVAWSPCGQWLASGGDDKMVYVYDAKTFAVKWPLGGHDYRVNSVSFSPDGKRLASGSDDKTVKIWNPSTGEQLSTMMESKPIHSVAFSPDGSLIAAGDGKTNVYDTDKTGTIRLYDAGTGAPVGPRLRLRAGPLAFGRTGDMLREKSDRLPGLAGQVRKGRP